MSTAADDPRQAIQAVCSFDDRWTMRWTRLFHVPLQRVWQAVTTSEELDIWFMPVCHVEARLGGAVQLSFGGPAQPSDDWRVTRFEPLQVVEYSNGELYAMRFELEAIDAATRLTFIEHIHPDFRAKLEAQGVVLPLVPGTPWSPGTAAGYHLMFSSLDRFFAADLSRERIEEASAALVTYANQGDKSGLEQDPTGEHARLTSAYHDFIRDQCPPE